MPSRVENDKFQASILIATIPIYYCTEDKNARFFGHEFLNDYLYRIDNNIVYHTVYSNVVCPGN